MKLLNALNSQKIASFVTFSNRIFQKLLLLYSSIWFFPFFGQNAVGHIGDLPAVKGVFVDPGRALIAGIGPLGVQIQAGVAMRNSAEAELIVALPVLVFCGENRRP